MCTKMLWMALFLFPSLPVLGAPGKSNPAEVETQIDQFERFGSDSPTEILAQIAEMEKGSLPEHLRLRLANVRALAEYWQGGYESARKLADAALREAGSRSEKKEQARALYTLSTLDWRQGKYADAAENINRAITIFEGLGAKYNLALAYMRSATIQMDLMRFPEAFAANEKGSGLFAELGERSYYARNLSNRSVIFYRMQDYPHMLELALQALKIHEELGERKWIRFPLINAGEAYNQLGQSAKAIGYFERSLQISRECGDKVNIAIGLKFVANARRRLNDLGGAMASARQALAVAQELKNKYEERNIYDEIAQIHVALGEYAQAYNALRERTRINDEVFNSELYSRLDKIQTSYEIERKQKEIALLQKEGELKALEIRRQLQLRNFFLALAFLLLVLAVIVSITFVQKVKAGRLIAEKNRLLEKLTRELEEISKTDPLTSLFNRRGILEKIRYETHRFERYHQPFSLAIADLDDFKLINDTNGHEFGDRVLVTVAQTIRNSLRKVDMVARWGGEEFLLLLVDTNEKGAWQAAEKVRQRVAEVRLDQNGHQVGIRITLGISEFNDQKTLEDCLRQADDALYQGKRSGKDRCISFSRLTALSTLPGPS